MNFSRWTNRAVALGGSVVNEEVAREIVRRAERGDSGVVSVSALADMIARPTVDVQAALTLLADAGLIQVDPDAPIVRMAL